jgi:hypothetical protein
MISGTTKPETSAVATSKTIFSQNPLVRKNAKVGDVGACELVSLLICVKTHEVKDC